MVLNSIILKYARVCACALTLHARQSHCADHLECGVTSGVCQCVVFVLWSM